VVVFFLTIPRLVDEDQNKVVKKPPGWTGETPVSPL
jgi:hypothetical protein